MAMDDNHSDTCYYESVKRCMEELSTYSKPSGGHRSSGPLQRKLSAILSCHLDDDSSHIQLLNACLSIAERLITELVLMHQVSAQLSGNLWAAVRTHGGQFLGPAIQEDVLKLILLALGNGAALSRKVLVMFIVSKLEPQYAQVSKTSVGHVVQLLYRASCFKVIEREGESSLMQLRDEFSTYESLCREHDSQIVRIASEAGLRIAPEQWSSLLYADVTHKSYMQSVIDKVQVTQTIAEILDELIMAVRRNGDPHHVTDLFKHLNLFADSFPEAPLLSWSRVLALLQAVKAVLPTVLRLMESPPTHCSQPLQLSVHYKTVMCEDVQRTGHCPRGAECTFAHLQQEMDRYRARYKRRNGCVNDPSSSSSEY